MPVLDDDSSKIPPFDFGTRLGIVFIVQSASLSAIAVTGLLLYILYSAVTIKRGASRKWTVSTHVHVYFINLLVSDLVQAIGGLMDIKWIVDAGVTEGVLCTAQGIFKQMGDVGVALTSLTIAVHTLGVLIFQWNYPHKTALMVISLIWTFIALIIGISYATHKGRDYYGDTQYWCWITEDFNGQRLGLEYLWIYIAAFGNIIIYAFLALVVKGVILITGRKIRFQKPINNPRSLALAARGDGHESNAIAMQLLFYPAVYVFTVSPIAVVRWMAFNGKSVPFAATAFASILFSSSGLMNVMLFGFTRPKLLPSRGNPTPTFNSLPTTFDSRRTRTPLRSPTRSPRYLPDEIDAEAWKNASRPTSFTMTDFEPEKPPVLYIGHTLSRFYHSSSESPPV